MTDATQEFVRYWADVVLGEPPEDTDAIASEDAEAVLKDMLTENTGRHILDSGGAHGRAFEENKENPPWEKPGTLVRRDYVVTNIFHYLSRVFERDRDCVALEAALYEYHDTTDSKWLGTTKTFPEWAGQGYYEDFAEFGLPEEFADILAAVEYDNHIGGNTYNSEFGALTQDFEFRTVNWDTSARPEYHIIHLHNGADIRGGYTAPRVFKSPYAGGPPYPVEGFFHCEGCGWDEAESCAWDSDQIIFKPDENEMECAECGGDIHYGV